MSEQSKDNKHWKKYRKPKGNKMKEIDLKTILIGIFVLIYIFFNVTDRMAKRHYMKMEKIKMHSDWKNNNKYHKGEIGKYVPLDNKYILNTTTGEVFKPEVN